MKETRDETRAEATHRLQREDRLDEATEYRREIRRQERAKGKTKAEAGEIAWAAMMEKFPPLDPERQPGKPCGPNEDVMAGPDPALAALRERTAGQPVDLVRDTLWVYMNMANENASPDDAPGMGAWNLLDRARRYRNHFFEKLLPKALSAKEKTKPHDEEEMVQTEGKSVEELRKVLRPFMEDVKLICPKCGVDVNEAACKKHLEARKVAEQRSRERFGDG